MRELKPVPTHHHNKMKPFCYKELKNCKYVFLRCEDTNSLEKPYIGSFKVISGPADDVYQIDKDGKPYNVSIERLKPAHLERVSEQTPTNISIMPQVSTENSNKETNFEAAPQFTENVTPVQDLTISFFRIH